MQTFMTVIHVIGALLLIVVILLQAGKGAAMGSGLGAGSSQTMFGSSGAGNILTKLTTGLAIVFMVTSLALATFSTKKKAKSVMQGVEGGTATEQTSQESPSNTDNK
jgi:preprotein translocase subunit SecG